MAHYAFVALKYSVPFDRISQTVDRHRAYLRELHAQGKLIASGPFIPREGGGLLVRCEDDAELREILARDPFQLEKLVETTVFHWAPVIGNEGLDALPKRPT